MVCLEQKALCTSAIKEQRMRSDGLTKVEGLCNAWQYEGLAEFIQIQRVSKLKPWILLLYNTAPRTHFYSVYPGLLTPELAENPYSCSQIILESWPTPIPNDGLWSERGEVGAIAGEGKDEESEK